MLAALLLLAILIPVRSIGAGNDTRQALSYTPSSVVNAASNLPGALAPNTIGTLYGQELAAITRALRPEDIREGTMPTLLPGTGVRVVISGITAQIYFVSPGQINFLVPANLRAVPGTLQVFHDGRAGPQVPLRLDEAAPALFEQPGAFAVAANAEGAAVGPDSPVHPGDLVVLYATGLGETAPPLRYGEIPKAAVAVKDPGAVQVLLDGKPAAPSDLYYAGVTPGFAGLYQINVRIPDWAPRDPEVHVAVGGIRSQGQVKLAIRPR